MLEYLFISVTASAIQNANEEGHNCLSLNPTVPKDFIWDECTFALVPMCANVKYTLNHYTN
jgi:hypothetical protein